jgi:hypothetical protein
MLQAIWKSPFHVWRFGNRCSMFGDLEIAVPCLAIWKSLFHIAGDLEIAFPFNFFF